MTPDVLYKSDTLDLGDMIRDVIAKKILEKHNLKVGIVLTGEASLITSGTCDPASFRFTDSTLNSD